MRSADSKGERTWIQIVSLLIITIMLHSQVIFAIDAGPGNETISIVRQNETVNASEAVQISESAIQIILGYKTGTAYDTNNDGIETIEGIIDFTVESTRFNWTADEDKLCTRWEIYSIDEESTTTVCYGSEECCSFIHLTPTKNSWDEAFNSNYGGYGATYKNTISAQVIYIDYNTGLDDPYADIYYSGWSSLSAKYVDDAKTILTRMKGMIIDKVSVVRGAIIKARATLIDNDEEPIAFHSVNIYLNETLIDTGSTDIMGNVEFEIDTSPIISGEYLLNIIYPGQRTMVAQEIVNYMPSDNSTAVIILPSNENISFNPVIKDALGNELEIELEIIDGEKGVIDRYEKLNTIHSSKKPKELKIKKGKYNINAAINNNPVKNIIFNDVDLTKNITEFIGLDDVPEEKVKEKNFLEVYAIDPTNINFTEATVTATAKGGTLYKCKDWNFEEQNCYGEWVFLQTITPGKEYTFTLTPDDPALGEIAGTFSENWESNSLLT
ncbi:MAG: hypothetical protein ABIJ08_00035, partial [Nanoarchaeota archaeon]